jgi:hypothetical protein
VNANPEWAPRMPPRAGALGLSAAPCAWYLQLCASYALASRPCHPGNGPQLSSLVILIPLAALCVALAAFIVSWRAYRGSRAEQAGGRMQFIALWGVFMSGGFAVAIVLSGLAFGVLPRCAG